MEGLGHEATPWRGADRAQDSRASFKAAFWPDLKIRFGHDLDPLEGGGARRHRSYCTHDSRGMRALAPPRYSGVLNKSLGFDRPLSKAPQRVQGRSHTARQAGSRGEQSLADVPEGRTRHTRILKS